MSEAIERYVDQFGTFERERLGDPVHPLRKSAIARLAEMGFPTTRQENWRFTNVSPIANGDFPMARPTSNGVAAADIDRLATPGPFAARLVLVDGHFRSDLSRIGQLPDGVRAMPLSQALDEESEIVLAHIGKYARCEDQPFVALNTAFIEDGAFVYLPKNAKVDDPIHILHITTGPNTCCPRHLIVAKEGSQACVVETYVSHAEHPGFVDTVTEVVVGANTKLDHCKLQLENDEALHVHATHVAQDRDSDYANHTITLGGRLTRNDIESVLDDENIVCTLNGLFHTLVESHVDNHTWLEHKKPHCDSHELYKGILDDASSGVFSGKIHVYEDAQKTDAKQSSANLLLSDTAVVDAMPQLEIYADDVKCTHGATIGQLDAKALFYLRSRGIPETQARNMLIRAFASDVAHRIPVQEIRDHVDALLTERLPGGRMDR
jgi:Fe-S cluster assembly protein SufD